MTRTTSFACNNDTRQASAYICMKTWKCHINPTPKIPQGFQILSQAPHKRQNPEEWALFSRKSCRNWILKTENYDRIPVRCNILKPTRKIFGVTNTKRQISTGKWYIGLGVSMIKLTALNIDVKSITGVNSLLSWSSKTSQILKRPKKRPPIYDEIQSSRHNISTEVASGVLPVSIPGNEIIGNDVICILRRRGEG